MGDSRRILAYTVEESIGRDLALLEFGTFSVQSSGRGVPALRCLLELLVI